MSKKRASAGRTIRTPVVLAAASAMVSVGVVAALGPSFFERQPEPESKPGPLRIEAETPESAAESYLDAYRRREHEAAIALAVGPARAQAEARMERDARATEEELAAKEHLWDRMAAPRLALVVTERDALADGGVLLRGRAEGLFIEHRYVREVEFEVVRAGDEWRVARMDLGDVLEGPSLRGAP